jgi:uncharacterized protein YjbJ (UPF0337 family)
MNLDTAAGKIGQLKGKAKQSVGEAIGDSKLANSGTADQVKGAFREAWGNTKDAAQALSHDAHASAQAKSAEASQRAEDKGHDVREKIAATAQKVKNAVNAKADEIKTQHKRSA